MQLKASNLLMLLGLVTEVAADGGYKSTCNSISFYNARDGTKSIFANCRKPDGTYHVDAFIDSGVCFANDNGVLVARLNGGYPGSCKSMGLKGTVLHAQCKNNAGTYGYTTIETNDWIGNYDGVIKCFGHNRF